MHCNIAVKAELFGASKNLHFCGGLSQAVN